MNRLLLEIGTEEIPAGYIEPALKALSAVLKQKLTAARIEHGSAVTFGTPRRIAVEVENVVNKQSPVTTDIIGPPLKVGFDEQGNPTVAAKKFAERAGIPVGAITIQKTKKGSYLCARKTERGLASKTILKNILPDVIAEIPFPKTMRWADLTFEFARPIHWILALLGDDIIPFVLGDIKSGKYTFGHRFLHPGRIKVKNPDDYVEILHDASVLVDMEERKKVVEREIATSADDLGGKVLPDGELVEIVNNLVEYPAVVSGKFDSKFLELPREVLITAMREHQKYFAVVDKDDNLRPFFIAVNNTPAKDIDLVAKGHERVLRARLEDAQFFFRSDQETSFDDWMEKLQGVLFQAKLGSVYEKVLRVGKLSAFLVDAVDLDPVMKKQVLRAASLCKSDLVSQVVVEFPKLQGIMGRVYASKAGEPETVAAAIEEHYRPTYSGGPLPDTIAGALLSIADKMDSICGCFHVGLFPTGASDPYALRRQCIGIVQIMLEKGFSFSLGGLVDKSLTLFDKGSDQEIKETAGKVYTFVCDRIAHLLADERFPKDVIAAVVAGSVDHVPGVWERVRTLSALKTAPDFEPLAVAFKRVVNIIKQANRTETAKADDDLEGVNENLFQDECESALFAAYKEVKKKVSDHLGKGSFDRALLDIASLRDPVDTFFDGVLVMTDDKTIRRNRLELLRHIATLFEDFADFSKIST
ncbi:glycine--tRNA ligase subunit beta [Thermodesulfobacteriota bacterium]